jgi:hypothetical protein
MTDPRAQMGPEPQPPPGYPGYWAPPPGYPGPPAGWPPPPAPKPGVIPLRRLGVGEILDGAISYVRANPKVTLGLSAVVITISQLIQVPAQAVMYRGFMSLAAVPGERPSLTRILPVIGSGLVGSSLAMVVAFVAQSMLTGLLMVVLSRAVLGHRVALGEVWSAARPRLAGVVGIIVLIGVALVLVVAVAAVPVVVLGVVGVPGAVVGLLVAGMMLVAVCVAVYLYVSWSLAVPAYLLENISVFGALGRSFQLVLRQWWRVFAILLLGQVIVVVLGLVLAVPFSIIGELVAGSANPTGAVLPRLVISAVGTIIASTITRPFAAGITGLLYIDQRIRREGLDIELARAAEAWGGPRQ